MVATPDRFNELEKVIKSLRRYHKEPVCVMVAEGRHQAHEFKTLCGILSPFKNTIMMDIDMYVLQNFEEVFDIVKDGKIAIYEEKIFKTYNSGFVAFEKELMMKVSHFWHKRYLGKDVLRRRAWKGLWEQDILSSILKGRDRKFDVVCSIKGKVFNLTRFYNYCIYKFSIEQEELDWDQIKVLHYWYRSGNKPDPKRRSWREWIGEEVMVKGNSALVDEINRLLEIYMVKPRLNMKRIGVLNQLLKVHRIEIGEITGEKAKDFKELESLKAEQKKSVEKPKKEEAKKQVTKKKEDAPASGKTEDK